MNNGVCTLTNVTVEPHFDKMYPLYKIVGEPTSDPERGQTIADGTVTVKFEYTNGLGNVVEKKSVIKF